MSPDSPPAIGPIRRYVRAVTSVRGGRPLALPQAVKRFPALLRLFEPLPSGGKEPGELSVRLHLAMLLAETTPRGASLFCNSGQLARYRIIGQMAGALALDLALMAPRYLFSRFWR